MNVGLRDNANADMFLPIIVEFVQVPVVTGFGFGSSIVVSGLVLVPLSAGTFLASRFLQAYERRFGARTMIPLGALVFSGGAIFFALSHSSVWEAFVAVGVAGLGIGFTFAAMPGFIVRAVPQHETGSATGFYQVLRNIGLSVGSALGVAVLASRTPPGHTFPAIGGFRAVLLLAAGLGAITGALSFFLPGSGISARIASAPAVSVEERQEGELTGLMLAGELEPIEAESEAAE